MSSNIKTIVVIVIVLIISFSTLVLIEKIFDTNLKNPFSSSNIVMGKENFLTTDEFFRTDFSNQRVIFLLGSSHVGEINVIHVNDLVSLENDFVIYNLAFGADPPSNRLRSLDKIISVEPEMIFYGISYRDFSFPYQTTVNPFLPYIRQIISCKLYSDLSTIVPQNPQLITRDIMNKILKIEPEKQSSETFSIPKTPFYQYNVKSTIASNEMLKHDIFHALTWDNDNTKNQNICAINKIISKLQDEEIKIILFTTPLHDYYLESFSISQKNNFIDLKNNLSKKFGLKIYEFEEKYNELNIWRDTQHISHHQNVTIFNEDIAEMIMENIEK